MSLKNILKNSFQTVLFLSMGNLDYIFQPSLATTMFMLIVVIVYLIISELWKKSSDDSKQSSSKEDDAWQNFQKTLFFMKHVSNNISKDREFISKSLAKNVSLFQEHIFNRLESLQAPADETVFASLEKKYSVQNQQAVEILEILRALERDFLELRSELEQASPSLEKLVKTENQKLFAFKVRNPNTKTEGNQELHEEELLFSIIQIAKEGFEKLAFENRTRSKDMIQSISRFLEHSQKDFQKEMTIFSSAVAKDEHDNRSSANSSLVAEVEKIEKNLLDTFIFLNRQRFDMENMKKTLEYFTEKFVYVAFKFDAYYEQSKTSYTRVTQWLKETETFWNSVTKKLDTNSDLLLQHSRNLASTITEIHNVLKVRERNIISPFTMSCKTQDEPDVAWTQHADMHEKLHDILALSENSYERLNSLARMSESLKNCHNLLNGISEGYNILSSSCLSSLEGTKKFESCQHLWRNESGENCKKFAIGGRNRSDNNYKGEIPEKENDSAVDSMWDELCQELHELNSEFSNEDIDNIMFILKDVVKTSWDVVHCENSRSDDGSVTDSNLDSACNETYLEANDHWEGYVSESPLEAITSSCLVNSSELDESPDVM